ncbi:MAG: aldo/keto reductase [Planctomycetota bacterium]
MFDRRVFLRSLMGLTAGLAVGRPPALSQTLSDPPADGVERDRLGAVLPRRRLGRTGEAVTLLGFGGSHLLQAGGGPAGEALVERALAEGVRFFDTAQQYGSGESERRMGRWLTPKYRDVVYVMTKTQARDADHARRDMDGCRQRLNVDVLDLMQIHHIEDPAAVDRLVDNGVVDVLLEAREKGQVRHLGFTGHNNTAAHLRMLERLERMGVELDTCQMPVNVADPGHDSFILRVMPALIERGYGVLAMKTLVFGQIVGQDNGWGRNRRRIAPRIVPERMSLAEALGFVWSLPVSTLISGTPTEAMLTENAGIARRYPQLDEAQRQALINQAAEFAGPQLEFYKRAPRPA